MFKKSLSIFFVVTFLFSLLSEGVDVHESVESIKAQSSNGQILTIATNVNSLSCSSCEDCHDNESHEQSHHCSKHCSSLHNIVAISYQLQLKTPKFLSYRAAWRYDQLYNSTPQDPALKPPMFS